MTVVTIGPSGIDHYYETDEWPAMGGKALLHNHRIDMGGMIANTAAVLGALGAPVQHLERIGLEHSEQVLASLSDRGVDVSLMQVSDTARTPTAFVVRQGGERSILIDVGGREELVVTDEVAAVIGSAATIITSLAELRHPPIRVAVAAAATRGVPLALDIERAGLADPQLDNESIEMARYLIINDAATDLLTMDLHEAAKTRDILITRGAEGSTLLSSTGSDVDIPAFTVTPVDTTGCSDTFLAAFVYERLVGADAVAAATFASAAAARAATGLGPRSGAVDAATVREFADSYRAD